VTFPDPPGNKLIVLRAKINDEYHGIPLKGIIGLRICESFPNMLDTDEKVNGILPRQPCSAPGQPFIPLFRFSGTACI
jgi:hypothetical protein